MAKILRNEVRSQALLVKQAPELCGSRLARLRLSEYAEQASSAKLIVLFGTAAVPSAVGFWDKERSLARARASCGNTHL